MTNRKISCIEIDINGKCDFHCSFCYFTKKNEMSIDDCKTLCDSRKLTSSEIIDIVCRAKILGIQKIILYTGNFQKSVAFLERPGADSKAQTGISSIIDFIRLQDMNAEVRISGSCMDKAVCSSCDIKCLKHKSSCFITFNGIVLPCAGMTLPIGNLRRQSLEKIINNSEVLENLADHEKMIKGPCRDCTKFSSCYGCRGRAFAMTGDYLASDPLCKRNQDKDKAGRIGTLPMSVDNLIPQKSGMRLVSALLKIGERRAEVESVFFDDSPFVKKDGSLEEIAFMEIMAQSAAVMNGFEKFDTDSPEPKGFLIGGENIKIFKKVRSGERLITKICKTVRFGNFGILSAKIMRSDDLIAEGEIKIYQYGDE